MTKESLLQPRKCWLSQIRANHALKRRLLWVKLRSGSRTNHRCVPLQCSLTQLGWLLRSHSPISRVFPLEPWQLFRHCVSYEGQRETPWVPKLKAKGKSQNKDLAPTDKSQDTRPETQKRRASRRGAGSGNSEGKSHPAQAKGLAETLVNNILWLLPQKGVPLKSNL